MDAEIGEVTIYIDYFPNATIGRFGVGVILLVLLTAGHWFKPCMMYFLSH